MDTLVGSMPWRSTNGVESARKSEREALLTGTCRRADSRTMAIRSGT
jgi:hypothetical protein